MAAQIIHRPVTHGEIAHRYRQYGMHEEAARQDALEREHRATFGEVVARRVYGDGPAEFMYVRRKLEGR